MPKQPQHADFQFFDTDRLNELYEKETAYEIFKHQQAQKKAAAEAQVRPIVV